MKLPAQLSAATFQATRSRSSPFRRIHVDDRVLSLGLRILVGVGMVAAGCGGPGLDLSTLTAVALAHGQTPADESSNWQIDTTSDWQAAASQIAGLTMSDLPPLNSTTSRERIWG